MIFLRVLVIALLTGVALSALAWVVTRERCYLRLAWRLLVGGLFAALVFFAVLFVERLTATPIGAGPEKPDAQSWRPPDGAPVVLHAALHSSAQRGGKVQTVQ